MRKKLVIFDLDGTLLDSIADIAFAANKVLEHHGFPPHSASECRMMVGNGIKKLMERAIPEDYRSDEFVDQMKNEFAAIYVDHSMVDTRPYAGIPELLQALRDKGIEVAVASNKFQAATSSIIAHYFPEIDFHAVLGHREGKPTKPDATIVFDILGNKFSRQETLYVGDTLVDIQTAQNAGIECVAVTWGFRPLSELTSGNPDHIVNSPEEILPFCCQD